MKEKKQKKYSNNETLFRLDCWMALHQRICWLILALAAVGVMAMLVYFRFLPDQLETPVLFAFMLLFLLLYRWISGAPYRSMVKWSQRREAGNQEKYQATLSYIMKLEKALPDAMRRQLNIPITSAKAQLMAHLGRKEEALDLLRSFDQYWDESQRTYFQTLMNKISGEQTETEQKEN